VTFVPISDAHRAADYEQRKVRTLRRVIGDRLGSHTGGSSRWQ